MPDLAWESTLRAEGFRLIAGIDEAGRGPLAGPVSAAAVILPLDFEHSVLTDSKKLSPKRRDGLYEEITANDAIVWCSARATVEEIDEINILRATHLAMRRAFEGLSAKADAAVIDGLRLPEFPVHHVGVVKGDSASLSIAAASIIAKVERDREMLLHAEKYPEYGFEKHKGYGTKYHLTQLERYGPCPIHRQTFRPIAQLSLRFDAEN
ncbi:MAG: ribonuclease HII [Verrucomicrobiales bacterium]|jgi:ribonuclease HII